MKSKKAGHTKSQLTKNKKKSRPRPTRGSTTGVRIIKRSDSYKMNSEVRFGDASGAIKDERRNGANISDTRNEMKRDGSSGLFFSFFIFLFRAEHHQDRGLSI